jgi:hypothetical protein
MRELQRAPCMQQALTVHHLPATVAVTELLHLQASNATFGATTGSALIRSICWLQPAVVCVREVYLSVRACVRACVCVCRVIYTCVVYTFALYSVYTKADALLLLLLVSAEAESAARTIYFYLATIADRSGWLSPDE